jgi:hypothetical protein
VASTNSLLQATRNEGRKEGRKEERKDPHHAFTYAFSFVHPSILHPPPIRPTSFLDLFKIPFNNSFLQHTTTLDLFPNYTYK